MKKAGFFRLVLILIALMLGTLLLSLPSYAGAKPEAGLNKSPTTPKTLMMRNEELKKYQYQAQTVKSTGSKPRILTIREMRWSCEGRLCTTESLRPMLMLPTCKTLVAQVGHVTFYGRPGMSLSKRLLRKCNRVAPQKKLPKTTKAEVKD